MSNSKFLIDKIAKLFAQGLINYRDFSNEIINVLKSKRNELIFNMKLASKEEIEIINKRLDNLEKKINKSKKKNKKKLKR
tara:strand:- start:114 stop:353 length:240 start_codon:yes stop_codon:yes gene_type:complete